MGLKSLQVCPRVMHEVSLKTLLEQMPLCNEDKAVLALKCVGASARVNIFDAFYDEMDEEYFAMMDFIKDRHIHQVFDENSPLSLQKRKRDWLIICCH